MAIRIMSSISIICRPASPFRTHRRTDGRTDWPEAGRVRATNKVIIHPQRRSGRHLSAGSRAQTGYIFIRPCSRRRQPNRAGQLFAQAASKKKKKNKNWHQFSFGTGAGVAADNAAALQQTVIVSAAGPPFYIPHSVRLFVGRPASQSS